MQLVGDDQQIQIVHVVICLTIFRPLMIFFVIHFKVGCALQEVIYQQVVSCWQLLDMTLLGL